MSSMAARLIMTLILFGLAFAAMAIGLVVRGKIMRGGCGSATGPGDKVVTCDACSKRTLNLCDDDEGRELQEASFTGTLGRFSRKDT